MAWAHVEPFPIIGSGSDVVGPFVCSVEWSSGHGSNWLSKHVPVIVSGGRCPLLFGPESRLAPIRVGGGGGGRGLEVLVGMRMARPVLAGECSFAWIWLSDVGLGLNTANRDCFQ